MFHGHSSRQHLDRMTPTRRLSVTVLLLVWLAFGASSAQAQERAPRLPDSQHFTIDPVVDGLAIVGGATFDELLSLILSTGEIRPQAPGSPDVLLGIDKGAVTQTIDPNAAVKSNLGLWAAYAYVVADPLMSGLRDGR